MLAMESVPEVPRAQKKSDYRVFAPAPPTTSPKTARMNADSKTTANSTTTVVPTAADDPPARRSEDDAQHMHRHMWIVTGTAGSGKTTVAQHLAAQLQVPYIEGDDVRLPSPSRSLLHWR